MDFSIINPALSLSMTPLVIGQRQKSSVFLGFSLVITRYSGFHWLAFRSHECSTFTEKDRNKLNYRTDRSGPNHRIGPGCAGRAYLHYLVIQTYSVFFLSLCVSTSKYILTSKTSLDNTVQSLCIGTDWSQQTVQTEIRLQSDQGLCCLPFHQHLLDALMQCYIKLFYL